jgi:hypothetical protein
MNREEMLALAECCEQAIGREQGLSQSISEAVGSMFNYGFTSSVDAAARLVPDGFVWCAGIAEDDDGTYAWANVHNRDPYCDGARVDFSPRAATPALALCAAALRARAQASPEQVNEGEGR